MLESGSLSSLAISRTNTARSKSQPWPWSRCSTFHWRGPSTRASCSSACQEKSNDSGSRICERFSPCRSSPRSALASATMRAMMAWLSRRSPVAVSVAIIWPGCSCPEATMVELSRPNTPDSLAM